MYGNYNTGYGMSPDQQQLAQNRRNQMKQQYNGVGTYQPNSYQMQNNQQMGTMQIRKGRPVSSYDEAKVSMKM
jgi:hypothetical protein|nr:MAG TPA: hypothetical protein [Caudoviricetes sp.]